MPNKTIITDKNIQDLEISIQEYEDEYLKPFVSERPAERRPSISNREYRKVDITINVAEREEVSRFLSDPCPCGQNCQQFFSVSEVLEARENFRLMSWSEQHSFIVGKLQTFMRSSEHSVSARRSRLRERKRFDYFINADRPVCRAMFLFYHGESIDRLKRRQKYLAEIGTLPPDHGNTGRTPRHACKPADKKKVRTFIENFTAVHGLPDPGRDLRAAKGRLKVYLPTIMNYKSVHRIYEKSMNLEASDPVKYQTFRRLWIEYFPHIVFSKTKSDLCMTCEDNKKLINASIASGDEEYKLDCLMRAREHLVAAKKERDYYRASILDSKQSYANAPSDGTATLAPDSVMHYSWDFAQQLQFPYEDHQVGPIYFKSPRIAQLFGVCCEAIPRQVNYLIDEADFPGKGADTVISLLDHFFDNYGLGEEHALLTADNCVGQNKNNAVIQYLMYRVITGKHKSITLSFMLVGHTKFSPDGYFGLIKKRYRRSKVYTYDHLVDVINSSTNGGFNTCQRYRNSQGSEVIRFRKWSAWLGQIFKKLPDITTYQHFRTKVDTPGAIAVKESVDAEEKTVALFKKGAERLDEKLRKGPADYLPKVLSSQRQWYLYEMIRPHIPIEADKESTAPKPKVSKPKVKKVKTKELDS
jgi:hypothetical protein